MNADEEDEDLYVILNPEEEVEAAVSTWISSTSKQQGQFKSSLVQKVVCILSVTYTLCCICVWACSYVHKKLVYYDLEVAKNCIKIVSSIKYVEYYTSANTV